MCTCNKLLKILALLVIAVVVIAGLQPADYHVERSLTMKASPAAIFAQVNDLHRWQNWSPWAKMDPNATSEFKGKAGKDASMHWAGNNQVGVGTMTITDSKPASAIALRLDFEKPMKGTATSNFTFTHEADGTKVTWSMDGHKNFMGKLVGLVMNCDKMIGDMYDQGLTNLKGVVKG